MRTRSIELYFGVGGDSGTWFTEYVDIPYNTPTDKISEVAIEVGKEDGSYAFVGVYAIPDLTDSINDPTDKNGFIIEVGDTIHCDATEETLEFTGTVIDISGEYIVVEDMEGNAFSFEEHQVEMN